MTGRIFRSILLASITVLLFSLFLTLGFLYRYFGQVQEEQLREALSLAAAATEQDGGAYLNALHSESYRLTWVAADGTVLHDTQADAASMDNHADREEIREALVTGVGSSTRLSATLTQETLYEAVELSDGTVLRISISRDTSAVLAFGMLPSLLIAAVVAFLLSAALAKGMAKRVVEPLNRLDLEHPLSNDAYKELSPLLGRIHQQHQQIAGQMQELRRKTDEFEQITRSMQEGLVLLDARGIILSINPAARAVFGADERSVGQDFLTVDRRHNISLAIETALRSGHSKIRDVRGGREYQMDFSRIASEGDAAGVVLLVFDISEQALAERSRQEFTANVSHELKSPLQSIIGSAELLEGGLVQPEDMPRFVGRIRREAVRLVTLIEDTIRLSQLDEGGEMPREEVMLAALADEVACTLRDAAAEKNVRLSVTGNGAVRGVRRLLYEIIYNLCDNAIKYNVEGGLVEVLVSETEAETTLSVRDTGIGIPPEHQSRVFERFYRVDKSHSKQSGGTGLGLSIVKHAVQYHHGRITLRSDSGRGTTITVSLPKNA